jgi:hypothetical protein
MTVDQVGLNDLRPDSSRQPSVTAATYPESDCNYHPERNLPATFPGPILISFDDNRLCENDERLVTLSSRSRFFIIIAMMLPLSVAFTTLSNHILDPISYHISSELFSSEDKVYKNIQPTHRKTLLAKIVNKHRSEVRISDETDTESYFAELFSSDISMYIATYLSWLLEKSNLSYIFRIYGDDMMNMMGARPESIMTSDTRTPVQDDIYDMPSLLNQIWNNGEPAQQAAKATERDHLLRVPDPGFQWTMDSASLDGKSRTQTPKGNFPLIRRLFNNNKGNVKDSIESTVHTDHHKHDSWHMFKSTSSPIADESLHESFIPMVFRYFSPASSGQHSDPFTMPSPTPSPQLHIHLTQSAPSQISNSDQPLETSRTPSRLGHRHRGTRRRSTSIRFRRVSA